MLSNNNDYIVNFIKETSDLFDIVDGAVISAEEHQIKPYEAIYNTIITRYSLIPNQCVFIDDNIKNIETGNKMGFISELVELDNIESVKNALKKYELIRGM